MNAKRSLMVLIFLVTLLALAVGCSSKPADGKIIGDVAVKIQGDPNIQTKAISVQAQDGVVTLSGQVQSEMERTSAANDASQVEGVKTVVNNLTLANAAAPAAEQPAPEPVQQPVQAASKSSARHSSPKLSAGSRGSRATNDYAPPSAPVAQNVAPAVTTPAAPPRPTTVTIPDGTQLSIRLIDPLDSEKNQVGDSFRATLSHSIAIDGQMAIPAGADVMGRVIEVKDAAHFSGSSLLAVELTNLSVGGKSYELRTDEWRKQGTARGKNTAAKVGGGAAVGAVIGAIAGGGKGAAIGSVIGAGAGTGVQAATKGQQIRLPSETVMNFTLQNPLTVTPTSRSNRQTIPADESE